MALMLRGLGLSGVLPRNLSGLTPEVLVLADNPGAWVLAYA
jgi:hypothetical protein